MRAAFDLTGETRQSYELRERACAHLLPWAETPREILENLNDTSIGHVTIVGVFEQCLDCSACVS